MIDYKLAFSKALDITLMSSKQIDGLFDIVLFLNDKIYKYDSKTAEHVRELISDVLVLEMDRYNKVVELTNMIISK